MSSEVVFLVDKNELKLLSCVFSVDVLCSYHKDATFGVMNRCFKCPHYRRFEREMDEQDERIMDEIDEIRKHGYLRGELR